MKANPRKRSKLVATIVQFMLPYCLRRYRFTDSHQANFHREFQLESTTKKSNIQYQDFGKLSEDPKDRNVWKPKHASKSTEEEENPDKTVIEVIKSTGLLKCQEAFITYCITNRQC
jgi:hypothetical protein